LWLPYKPLCNVGAILYGCPHPKAVRYGIEVMSRVDQLANRDSQVADLVVPLRQTDWTIATPRAFWQSHCSCLVALKDHPKLAEDSAFHAKVSELVSSEFSCWEMEASLVLLGSVWEAIEKRFDKESARHKSMDQLMKRVDKLARRDSQVADLVVPLGQTDWTTATPRAFWQSHCRCLVALKDHPKLADDVDYQDCVSTLLSATFSLSMIGDGLEPLRFAWKRVEQGLDKQAKRPPRYVSLGWYTTSLVAIVLVAVLLGMDLVYQYDNSINDLKAELVALDNKQSERLTIVDDKLSKQLTTLDDKQAQTAQTLRTELAAVDNKHVQTADDLSKRVTEVDDKHVQTAGDLSKRVTELDDKQAQTTQALRTELAALGNEHVQKAGDLSKQLAEVDNKLVQKAGELSKQLTALDNKQAETAGDLSNNITAVDNEHDEKADELSKQITEVDNKLVQKAGELSKQLTALDNKQAQTADDLSKKLTVLSNKQAQTADNLSKRLNKHVQTAGGLFEQIATLDNKQAQTVDNLSNKLTAVDNEHDKKARELSKRLTEVDNKQAQTAGELSKRLTEVDNKLVQKAGDLSKRLEEVDNNINWLSKAVVLRDRLKDGSYGPKMVVIPAGKFRMGDIQGGGSSNEQPVHKVSVKSFAMGRYEVTFAEYDKFAEAMGRTKPSDNGWGRGNRPVINVSWHDVTAYAKWLTEQTGHQYRLPTEAEWEYAARAGTETKYWWGNDIGSNQANCYANYCGDSFKYTAPVGSFKPNAFGLYDTVGNVWEWTCSEYEGTYSGKEQRCAKSAGRFAVRGASWGSEARRARSAFRIRGTPTSRNGVYGGRLARMQ